MGKSFAEMKASLNANAEPDYSYPSQHKLKRYVQESRLLDDSLMTVVFNDNIELAQFVVNTILEREDLIVKQVKTQDTLKNLRGHSVRLDVHAVDDKGKHYNIEVQRASEGASFRRVRYNSSLLDCNNLPAGEDYDLLPDNYIIFITEKDILKGNKSVYHVDKFIRETGIVYDDGVHIIFANASSTEDNAIGKLMHDFRVINVDDMYYSIVARSVRKHKEDEEGDFGMCDLAKKVFKEEIAEAELKGKVEAKTEIIRMMYKNGLSLEVIASSTETSLTEVQRIIAVSK